METYPDQDEVMLEHLFLGRAQRGDHDAFVVLGSMYSEQLYAIARNLSSSDEEALELTQGAFQQAWKELSAIPDQLPFRIFVGRFLVREAVDRLRRAAPAASVSLERFLPQFEKGKYLPVQPWDCPAVNRLARRRDIAERIREALSGIPAEDRAAFVLWKIEGLPLEEAAAILEIAASVVRHRAGLACLLLSGYLQQLVGDGPAA